MLHPSAAQLAWQQLGMGVFAHFGVNTFAGVEWSDGTLPASSFDPSDLDADEWVRRAKEWGARYFILTAKHHDGFCLWPSATTDYSVAASPWKGGQGDVVGEVAEACARHGLPLGLYLSPWDRHEPCYDTGGYDDFYAAQLEELCTGYGPLSELWFDGAGSEGHVYDWPRFMDIVHRHQSQAMVFNMGAPTIRWVGNEDGLAADPVEYVVTKTKMSNYTTVSYGLEDALYLPPECDVSLRHGWFWDGADAPKSVDHMLAIYERSVGMGCNLLLNIPPDRRGRLDPADVAVMDQWAKQVRERFGSAAASDLVSVTGTCEAEVRTWTFRFVKPRGVDCLELVEDLSRGQRIEGFEVRRGGIVVASGGSVGVRRIVRVDGAGADAAGADAGPADAAGADAGPAAGAGADAADAGAIGGGIDDAAAGAIGGEFEIVVRGSGAKLERVAGYRTGGSAAPQIPAGYRAPTEVPADAPDAAAGTN